MKNKINLIVLMGGKSSEFDVSVVSGGEVVKHLDPGKYEIYPLLVEKDGVSTRLIGKSSANINPELPNPEKRNGKSLTLSHNLQKSLPVEIFENQTVVFIAMHGKYGEDGTVQGMLEAAGLRYTGSGIAASSIGMDKELFRKFLSAKKINIPKYFTLKKGGKLENKIKYPVFIKPACGGSSIGCSIAKNNTEFIKGVKKAFNFDERVLVDEYINGMEVTCGVLGNENPLALPLVEIRPLKNRFFDYDSKYTESGADEIVPANLPKKLTREIQDVALNIYKLLGVKGFGRVDFIVKDNQIPVVLEINTIPGLTPTSLLPKAAKAYGLSYSQLLDKIISYARE